MKSQLSVANWRQIVCALLLGCFLITAIGCAGHMRRRRVVVNPSGPAKIVYVQEAPPPARVETRTARPAPKAVWISGHWDWTGRKYVWRSGHWERNPRGNWVAGRWQKRRGGWVWVGGRWR